VSISSYPRLTKRQDPIVTRFREAAARQQSGADLVLLEGTHVVLEAMRAGIHVDILLATLPHLDAGTPERQELWSLAQAATVPVFEASDAVMDAASPVRTPSGVVALARWQPAPMSAIWNPPPALAVALVDVQDPGNAGAVVRGADGLDATGVVMTGSTADPGSWKALRGAMGSTFRLPVARGSAHDAIDQARAHGVAVLAAVSSRTRGAEEIRTVDLTTPVLLLLGNEGAGLPAAVQAAADRLVCIAMRPGLDSFNVSVTAGLLLYEARRQRTR
jgi:TrmH family RNA methyltransferase